MTISAETMKGNSRNSGLFATLTSLTTSLYLGECYSQTNLASECFQGF